MTSQEKKDLVSRERENKSLRPALIISKDTVSDYEIFLSHLLVGLADASIPVTLVCPPTCDVDSIISGAVEVIRYPIVDLPFVERLDRNRLVERLVKFKPNVLHCLCESRASLTRWLAQELRLPYVLTVNSLQRHRGRLPISWRHCAAVIAPTGSIAADIARIHPRLAERIEQINIGTFVEQDCMCFSEPSRLASMVTAQSLDNVAGFETLFGAVRHLVIGGYEFMLVVMGAGRLERPLWKLLAALDLLQTVTIVPWMKPWRSVLAAGDIFIQPQPVDVFNPLLLEAMGVGSAVAACKGGVDDFIIADQTAVVFDPDDELSIKASLQRLLDRKEFARQLAKSSQAYLRENHSVSEMVTAILLTYRKAQNS